MSGPLLLMVGSRAKRKIIHRSVFREGHYVPRCNVHYAANHDNGRQRGFRQAVGKELNYKVCGRCDKLSAFQ